MVDHHVDRPEVEAEQSVQLTGTNRSIGLTHRRGNPAPYHRPRAAPNLTPGPHPARPDTSRLPHITSCHMTGGLPGLVAIARGQTPDPIPNSAVKTLSAHGTAAQAVEE